MTLPEPFATIAAMAGWIMLAVWRTFAHGLGNVAGLLGPWWALAWLLVVIAACHVAAWGWARTRRLRRPRDGDGVAAGMQRRMVQLEADVAAAAAVGGTSVAVALVLVAVLWEWSVLAVGAVLLARALRHRRRILTAWVESPPSV